MINVNGIDIVFDIEQWLSPHRLGGQKRVGSEIFACCPFHNDTQPSWSVNVDTGVHNCFSCGAGGSLGSLVKRLGHHDTIWDAEQWLVDRFGVYTSTVLSEPLELDFRDPVAVYTGIPESHLTQYAYRHPYLGGRGISESWQQCFDVGYSRTEHAITIPWRFADGTLATIKKRSVATKRFWYDPPVPSGAKGKLVWGIDKIVANADSMKCVAITESETDAMYIYQCLWDVGCVAVAIGGSTPSVDQLALIHRWVPPKTEIIIMTDNDRAGRSAASTLIVGLAETFTVTAIDWGEFTTFNDINDMPPETLTYAWEKRVDAVAQMVTAKLMPIMI